MPVLGEEVERAAAPVDEDPPQLRAGGADLRCGARRVRRRGRNAQPICERQGGGDDADRENQALHLVLLPDAFRHLFGWLLSIRKDSCEPRLFPSPTSVRTRVVLDGPAWIRTRDLRIMRCPQASRPISVRLSIPLAIAVRALLLASPFAASRY